MNFIIPALQSADTFPQAVACAPRRCGGGKVSAGGASFRFRGVALPSVLGGSVRTLGWLYFAVQLALMGRYLHGARKKAEEYIAMLKTLDGIKAAGMPCDYEK